MKPFLLIYITWVGPQLILALAFERETNQGSAKIERIKGYE